MMTNPFVLLLPLLLAVPASAQDPAAPGGQSAPAARITAAETVTLSFRGGSLKELLDAIRAQAGTVNIVASELAAAVNLPAIELRQAPLQSALESIAMVVPEPYRAKAIASSVALGAPVYSLAIVANRGGTGLVEVRVFSLDALSKPLPGDAGAASTTVAARTVLSAIEVGARVLGEPIELRFHEESLLLFVKGTKQQLELVQQVLGNLQRDQERQRNELRQRAAPAGGQAEAKPK